MGEKYAFNEQNSFKACPWTMVFDFCHSRGRLPYAYGDHSAG